MSCDGRIETYAHKLLNLTLLHALLESALLCLCKPIRMHVVSVERIPYQVA